MDQSDIMMLSLVYGERATPADRSEPTLPAVLARIASEVKKSDIESRLPQPKAVGYWLLSSALPSDFASSNSLLRTCGSEIR